MEQWIQGIIMIHNPTNTRALKLFARILVSSSLIVTSSFAFADTKVQPQTSVSQVAADKSVQNQAIVYLNKSTVEQLVTLKGIGEKKAQAILAYRKQMGSFKSVHDLTKVKGIGEKVLIDNKARLKI